MSSNVVGVDIGSEMIRAVEVKGANTAAPRVVKFGSIQLPPSSARRGEVIDIAAVSGALRKLWSSAKFTSKDVVLGIGGPRVLARDFSFPAAPIAHVRESLPFQVQDVLPMPVADALLDFYPISKETTNQGEVLNGLLIAAVREAVVNNVAAATKAKLKVLNVDLLPFALVRALSSSSPAGTVVFVSVGARTTNLVVAKDGVPQLVRILPIGGHDIDSALINRFGLTPGDARELKFKHGLVPAGASNPEHPEFAAINEVVSELLDSVRDTTNYYSKVRRISAIRCMVITGGGSRLKGLKEALHETSGLEVLSASTLASTPFPRSGKERMSAEAQDDFALALGLAVGSAE